jgi:hypothetical protein
MKKYFSFSREYLLLQTSLDKESKKKRRRRRECYENAAGRLTDFIDVCVNNEKGKKTKDREKEISLLTIAQVVTFHN